MERGGFILKPSEIRKKEGKTMSENGTPREECLYCHGIINFSGPCPGCREILTPEETRVLEFEQPAPVLEALGNFYLEFSLHHPHV